MRRDCCVIGGNDVLLFIVYQRKHRGIESQEKKSWAESETSTRNDDSGESRLVAVSWGDLLLSVSFPTHSIELRFLRLQDSLRRSSSWVCQARHLWTSLGDNSDTILSLPCRACFLRCYTMLSLTWLLESRNLSSHSSLSYLFFLQTLKQSCSSPINSLWCSSSSLWDMTYLAFLHESPHRLLMKKKEDNRGSLKSTQVGGES